MLDVDDLPVCLVFDFSEAVSQRFVFGGSVAVELIPRAVDKREEWHRNVTRVTPAGQDLMEIDDDATLFA